MADFTKEHIEQLRQLAQDYDRGNGTWPESKHEGLNVYSYIWHRLTGEPDPCRLLSFRSTEQAWEAELGQEAENKKEAQA